MSDAVTAPFGHWVPVALLATIALGVSCAPATATMAFPSPSVSLVRSFAATPEPTTQIQPPVTPSQPPVPTTAATGTVEFVAAVSSTRQPEQKLNLDAIAPPSHARDLILQNCATCHSFVCAFRSQRTVEHWQTIKQDMRDKVSQLDDQEYDALFAYLEANFNDQKPEPELPPELQQLGCGSGVR